MIKQFARSILSVGLFVLSHCQGQPGKQQQIVTAHGRKQNYLKYHKKGPAIDPSRFENAKEILGEPA
jgi:hypothetical protein